MANQQSDTLLTSAFENQVKLLQNSLSASSTTETTTPATTTTTTTTATTTTNDSKNNKTPQKPVFSHKSRKIRFDSKGEPETPLQTTPLTDNNIQSKIVMPPPPFELPQSENEDEARTSMLMSWYMAGYHTGYFEALRKFS